MDLNSFSLTQNRMLMIYRRNHLVKLSQLQMLTHMTPFYIYNGYDFFKQTSITFGDISAIIPVVKVNLATQILTREIDVTHKIKLTKAARIKQAGKKKALIKRGLKSKVMQIVRHKGVLNKKFKK